jgi:hypothetical protein
MLYMLVVLVESLGGTWSHLEELGGTWWNLEELGVLIEFYKDMLVVERGVLHLED